MSAPDVERVAAAYDAVYAALPHSPALNRLWRAHAMESDFPAGFEHISFLTLAEMRRITGMLALRPQDSLVDLACGTAGPGLWIAHETGATLTGIDISVAALAGARARAAGVPLSAPATFREGTFAATGIATASAHAVMSIDALQYAPSKQAAFDEAARMLRPGGRLVFVAFELDPARVAGLPIFGTDPVGDYRAALAHAGFDVQSYDETEGWRARVNAAYRAIEDNKPQIAAEMGPDASAAFFGEVALTLQVEPYNRRVLACAVRRSG